MHELKFRLHKEHHPAIVHICIPQHVVLLQPPSISKIEQEARMMSIGFLRQGSRLAMRCSRSSSTLLGKPPPRPYESSLRPDGSVQEVVRFPVSSGEPPQRTETEELPVLLDSKEHVVGYLSKILNARVYDAAIATELQHAKNLSAVRTISVCVLGRLHTHSLSPFHLCFDTRDSATLFISNAKTPNPSFRSKSGAPTIKWRICVRTN